MLKESERQMSFYSMLYSKIPENHLLKRIDSAVDFGFVNELLEGSYCRNFGRPAKEPELMLKLLLLQYLYNLSDVKVIEEANVNLAFLWFLGLNPEDSLPDPSLLAKFRTQRLKDITLDEVLTEIVRQAVENGVIKSKDICIDATHTEANCTKKVPERIMKHLAKKIFGALVGSEGGIPEGIDTQIPDYKAIDDHKESKRVMKEYLEKLIRQTREKISSESRVNEVLNEAEDILSDEKFLLQKGLRSLTDPEARVGRKSKDEDFFGYKTEYAMTADERIITAVDVYDGAHVDGKEAESLIDRTEKAGVVVEAFLGDKAYFRKDILDMLERRGIADYIPVSASVYKIDEELFSYNKDSDQWFCIRGNCTVGCKKGKTGNGRGDIYEVFKYKFKKDECLDCPYRDRCIGENKSKTAAKILTVTASAPRYYEKNQRQKTEKFKEHYKKRAAQEWKNGEMKRFHGLARARGWGLKCFARQAKLTAIAVNLKRIAALAGLLFPDFLNSPGRLTLFFSDFQSAQKFTPFLPKI
mgnify:CR=1 FL=1